MGGELHILKMCNSPPFPFRFKMMIKKDIAIVFDCGATNVRVIAMDTKGQIVASQTMPNETDADPHLSGGRIWDVQKIWEKLCKAAQAVTAAIDTSRIAGVTVTTFGVDGTFTDETGQLLYPVISWQCPRTQSILEDISKYISVEQLYQISGVYPYAFNTINKMIWFKENRPDVVDQASHFLFIPSLFLHKLTGILRNDTTMMGTSMMANLKERSLSEEIIASLDLDKSLFGSLAEPGEQAGTIHSQAADQTGIPLGTPAFFAGHDTQFAIYGSGADVNEPILSSGTWEILMSRTTSFHATEKELHEKLTTEADAIAGTFNIGQNWLGSGILEWFSRMAYAELDGDELYAAMISEAEQVRPGSHELQIDPVFFKDANQIHAGSISGLTIHTSRSQLYRAFLESLAFRLRQALEALQRAGNFNADRIICVGGGSKNKLWNQIRADVCQVPIQLIDQKETTVLGAALFTFTGAGIYDSPEEARQQIDYQPEKIMPSKNTSTYNDLYHAHLRFIKNLSNTRD